ncbi:hypothetical protein O7626_28035 [Micromonospora sp. WMMD1102]|uniref:hypothetical protein n=1 Tax=Micromonospora sp. WMMD1102 TaxID=3016105 RepID=UPI00241558A5|nr:hypothetical protein [Micromonospora sp. WMMD1102]MDG4789730.1 hypothetical protein [Micromonospora sp. WMMD1102]
MSAGTEPTSAGGSLPGGPPPPLPWRDVVRLRLTAEPESRPEWLVWYARWLALGAGLLLCGVLLAVMPAAPCTAADPCGPDRAGNVVVGLIGSLPLLALVRLEFASAVTAATVPTALGYELTQADHLPVWFYLLLVGYAVGCGLLARLTRLPRRHRAAVRDWHRRARQARPPRPARPPHLPLGSVVAGTVLLTVALALAAWSAVRQGEVDDQQRRAEVVSATVLSHPSWAEIQLGFPDGRPGERLPVYEPADYPVGSTVEVALDDAGLRQLVSEPYDVTPMLTLVTVLALLGLGVGARAAARVLAGRRFFRRPQPLHTVAVHQGVDRVYVYAGTGPDVLPLAEIQVRDRLVPSAGREPRPAVLHGVPVPGQWGTVTVDGRTLSPVGPVLLPEPTAPWLATPRRRGVLRPGRVSPVRPGPTAARDRPR